MKNGTLSTRIWGVQWAKHFPLTLSCGIVVEHQRFHEAEADIRRILPEVYQTSNQKNAFGSRGGTPHKTRYYEEVGDFFVFRDPTADNLAIGIAICVLKDHESMDFRTITLARAYQSKGIYPEFMECLATVLRIYDVSRIEGDVSPTNHQHHVVLAKMGFCNTGMWMSSEHGGLMHIVKFLRPEDEERYTNLFSGTSASDLSANEHFARRKAG